jgi:cell division septation protein DedD
MTATSRRARNYKDRSSMLAFGHFALPVAALVALGLLFVGIKLFFLTPTARQDGVLLSGPIAQAVDEEVAFMNEPSSDAAAPAEQVPSRIEANVLLAGPMSTSDSGGRVQVTKPTQTITTTKPAQTAKPQQAAKPQTSASPASGNKRVQGAPTGGKWAVQIGSFSKAEGASTVMSEMKKQGYTASVSQSSAASGSTFHRVRVAAGNSRDDANRLAAELEKKGYPVLVVSAN